MMLVYQHLRGIPQSLEKIGYTYDEYVEAFERAFLTFKFQRVYCPRKKKMVSMNSFEERDIFSEEDFKSFSTSVNHYDLNKKCTKFDMRALVLKYSLKPEGLSFLGPILPEDLVVKICTCEYDPITKKKFKREDHSDILITDRQYDDIKAMAQRTLKQFNFTPVCTPAFGFKQQSVGTNQTTGEYGSKGWNKGMVAEIANSTGAANSSKSLKDCFANSQSNAEKIFQRFHPSSQSQSNAEYSNSNAQRLESSQGPRQYGKNFLPNQRADSAEGESGNQGGNTAARGLKYTSGSKMDEELPVRRDECLVQPVFGMDEERIERPPAVVGFGRAFQQKYQQLEEEEQQSPDKEYQSALPCSRKMDIESASHREETEEQKSPEPVADDEKPIEGGSKFFKSEGIAKFKAVVDMLKVDARPSITKQTIGNFRNAYIQTYKSYSRQHPAGQ